MLKLKRLEIQQYRNVRPGTVLRFDDGVNLVLGRNASGKTTLLALLSAVCRSAFDGIANEEFVLEYELASERFTVVAWVSHERAEPSGLEVFGAGPQWTDHYEVLIADRHESSEFRIVSSPAPTMGATARPVGPDARYFQSSVDLVMDWSFIAATLANHDALSELRVELFEVFGSTFRFDESLSCFFAMTGNTSLLVGGSALPVVARAGWAETKGGRGGASTASGAFMPRELALGLQRAFRGTTPARKGLELAGTEKEITSRMASLLDVLEISISPKVVEHRVAETSRSFMVEGFEFEVTRPDGTSIHHERLSYGQKRLLAFSYYLECNPHTVIADELVNGLHHRWIDAAMTALHGRQAFLTSQNPLLFDYVEFDSVERVRSCFITCTLDVVDGREQMVWRNMSERDAQTFFDAYEVGIEHIGDILITRGLW